MARRNTCSYRGMTVGSTGWVPDDPTEFVSSAVLAPVGCSRLKCRRCKAMVRQRAEVACSVDGRGREAELYEADDWLALDFVERTETGRLYACRCTVYREVRTMAMEDPDFDPIEGDVRLPWRCAGHAVPKPPFGVDGLTLEAGEDFVEILRGAAHGDVPSDAHKSQQVAPIQWVYRLRARLAGTPLVDDFDAAMVGGLRSGDPEQIEQSLLYFRAAARSDAFGDALAAIDALPGGAGTDRCGPLDVLLARVESAGRTPDGLDEAAAERGLRLALVPTTRLTNGHVLALVGRDAVWAANHAVELAAQRPGVVGNLLTALYAAEREELIVVAGSRLADGDEPTRAALRAWIDSGWHEDSAYSFVIRQTLDGEKTA